MKKVIALAVMLFGSGNAIAWDINVNRSSDLTHYQYSKNVAIFGDWAIKIDAWRNTRESKVVKNVSFIIKDAEVCKNLYNNTDYETIVVNGISTTFTKACFDRSSGDVEFYSQNNSGLYDSIASGGMFRFKSSFFKVDKLTTQI